MGLFQSKKIRELEDENRELRLRINNIIEKEDEIRGLSDALKKLRRESAELNENKVSISEEVKSLAQKKNEIVKEIEILNSEALNLRQLKFDEQNALLEYSSKLDKIKNRKNEQDYFDSFLSEDFYDNSEYLNRKKELNDQKTSELVTTISQLESKLNLIKEETQQLQKIKTDLLNHISFEQQEHDKLISQKEKVKEILVLLEKRRDEMERINYNLEKTIAHKKNY